MPIVPQNIPRPQQNRTEVGVRSLHPTHQPSALKKGARRSKSAKTGDPDASALDRVSHDDANLMVNEVGDEPRRHDQRPALEVADLEAAPGHSTTVLRREGRPFRTENGRLVPPHFADVEQGNLQNAWLMATLAAVAEARPDVLIERVADGHNGDFFVRLGRRRFPVSPEFPTEGYAEVEPRGRADTLWVALFEKAFALDAACSYAELEAGNPSRALPLLVGGGSRRQRVRTNGDPEAEVRKLLEHRDQRHPMILVTRTGSVQRPLVADHAYALVDVDGDGGVKLYNPWGTRRSSRPLEAVLHPLPWRDARAAFEFLYVGGIV